MATNPITTPPDIVGETFKDYVNSQIKVRQKSHGSGYNDSNRYEKDLIYLNSRNSWIKMASSVVIGGDEGEKKLKDLGLSLKLLGDNLAKKSVLFNGITDSTTNTQKAGVASSSSTINNSAYGYGGPTHGLNPMPGLTSFVIGHNNIGSIRTATIRMNAHSPTQFGIINLLYIRLGFSMLIEWGNATYLDNRGKLKKMGPTIIDEDWFKGIGITALEFTEKTEAKRKAYYGNYDSFFGKVTNFSYKFNVDGSYDIELTLVSQGDVVESFKIDTLTPQYTLSYADEKQLNKSSILNKLWCFQNTVKNGGNDGTLNEEKKELRDVLASENKDLINPYSRATRYYELTEFDPNQGKFGFIDFDKIQYDRYYVRFGFLLEFLRDLVPTNLTKDKKWKTLEFNLSEKNYSKNYPRLVSFNPNICFINNDLPEGLFGSFLPYKLEGNGYLGTLLNIYIETSFITNTIQSIVSSQGKLTVFSLLKTICDGINSSLAGVTNLYPSLQDDYIVVIRDANLETRTDTEGEIISNTEESAIIETFGYNTNLKSARSNFVKDFDFTTTISKDLASMMSIGATAANTDVSEYSGFFTSLNKGLLDRYKEQNEPGEKGYNLEENCPVLFSTNEEPSILWEAIKATFKRGPIIISATPGGGLTAGRPTNPFGNDEEKQTENLTIQESYLKWYTFALTARTGTEFGVDFASVVRYFAAPEDGQINWEEGKMLFQSLIKSYDSLLKSRTTSNVGFIPMGVNLTLDGISGIKIYNQLKINTSHFPVGYPDTIELVVIGVDHKIENNSWVTEIRSYTKPKSKPKNDLEGEFLPSLPALTTNSEAGLEALAEESVSNIPKGIDPAPYVNPLKIGANTYTQSPTARGLKTIGGTNGKLTDIMKLTVIKQGGAAKYKEYYNSTTGTYDFLLETTVARKFNSWMVECRVKGVPENYLTISSAYRTREHQQYIVNNASDGRAAASGKSPHGWGGAVDFLNLHSGTTNPETNRNLRIDNKWWKVIASIGAKHGWYNPWRLSDMKNVDECWHFEYWGPGRIQNQLNF